MQIRNLFKVDPLKSFTELPAFWITIILSILISTFITLIILLNSDISWRLDYLGFNTLVEIFKVPLSILAIAITIIAILATMHRSAQTKEQIINANTQNAFSNYYKHIEEFEKYINSSINRKILIFENVRLTHKCLFPYAFKGDYTLDKDYLEIIEKEFAQIKNLLNNFNLDRTETVHNLLFQIYKGIDKCFSIVYIRVGRSGVQQFENSNKIVVPSNNIIKIIDEIKNSASLLIQLIAFDREIRIPKSLNQVANLIISQVPEWKFDSKQKFENFILFNDK